MTRAIFTAFLLVTGLLFASPGCADEGVGDPCTPEQEYDPSFTGFDAKEVNVESKSFQCRTRICLVNHFQGRASCPYGQNLDGSNVGAAGSKEQNPYKDPDPNKSGGCTVPGTQGQITGLVPDPATGEPVFRDTKKKALVAAQCKDRAADKAVYCSCRCADINGEKPSGQAFCDCPDGFACRPLVTSIGQGNEGLTGSYCIKDNTEFNKDTSCTVGDCDPVAAKCGE